MRMRGFGRRLFFGSAFAGTLLYPSTIFARENDPRIYKVVLTGGPCGGKSTALSKLTEYLSDLGYKVYASPEVPTILLTAGAEYLGVTGEALLQTESAFLAVQLAIEDALVEIAKSNGENAVIICDRGALDIRAYVEEEMWNHICESNSVSTTRLRDQRYDSVIHMVSAAKGAEQFYTKSNNAVRTESPELARHLDELVMQAWLGHRKHFVVDNSTDFKTKIEKVVQAISRVIGEPFVPHKHERRKVCHVDQEAFADEQGKQQIQIFNVQETVLSPNVTLIRRGQGESFSYTRREVKIVGDQVIELERKLSGREYVAAKESATSTTIEKTVKVFRYQDHVLCLEQGKDGATYLRMISSHPDHDHQLSAVVPKSIHLVQ